MRFDPAKIQSALRESWSAASSGQWTRDNPAAGQCNVTALLVQELFGGDLLRTPLPAGDHFYNWIEGRRYDFTASQFAEPITCLDLSAKRADAERGITRAESAALRTALRQRGVWTD